METMGIRIISKILGHGAKSIFSPTGGVTFERGVGKGMSREDSAPSDDEANFVCTRACELASESFVERVPDHL